MATRPTSRGRLVILEGLDGAGTSTQCAALGEALRAEGVPVVVTAEPSTGPVGALIRQALTGRLGLPGRAGPLTTHTLALLFAADRADHLAAVIEPALSRGAVVLSDRYLLSSLAYQGAEVGLRWVAAINQMARRPDLTLFLEVKPTVAARRRAARGGAEELYEAAALQRRTHAAYRRAIRHRRRAGERVQVLDGGRPVAEVTRAALVAILARVRGAP
jgi:dTMP kinase